MTQRHRYRPISEAPRDGTPIIAVCGGVECCVCWNDPVIIPSGWWHWDEEDMCATLDRATPAPTEWREMF